MSLYCARCSAIVKEEAEQLKFIESLHPLTPMEKKIGAFLVGGVFKDTKEIAEWLGIEVSTVRTHKVNLFEKLQVHSVGQLAGKFWQVVNKG